MMRLTPSLRRPAGAALLAAGVLLALSAAVAPARADDAPPAAAAPKDTVREEVGKPLQAAQKLIADKKFKDALAKVKEAEAIPNRTPYENFMIDNMRASAAAQDGQDDIAAVSFENMVASGRLPPATQSKVEQALAGTFYKQKNYAKAISWAQRYLKEGGTEGSVQDILFASLFYSNDYKTASSELHAAMDADDKAGRTTAESRLQMALNSDQKIGNGSGASQVLERLLAGYPSKTYWDIAISHVVHKSGFAERLDLDLLRLQYALGDLRKDNDYMALAQYAMEAGFPTEAKHVLDQGFSSGMLGKGPEGERQKRLQAKAAKDSADDVKALGAGDADAEKAKSGDGMVNTGFNYVINGKAEHGLGLIEAGLKKGGLKHPEDSKLHYGIALNLAGNHARAIEVLRSVQGGEGAGDLAHLWAVYIAGKK